MLGQLNLWGKNKVEVAIDRLQSFEPKEGYYLAFSGGKDSQCIYHLAKMAEMVHVWWTSNGKQKGFSEEGDNDKK